MLNSCLDRDVQLLLRQLRGFGCYRPHLKWEQLTLPRSRMGEFAGFMGQLWDSTFITGGVFTFSSADLRARSCLCMELQISASQLLERKIICIASPLKKTAE